MKCCFSEKGNPSFKIGAANVKEVETMSVERVLLAFVGSFILTPGLRRSKTTQEVRTTPWEFLYPRKRSKAKQIWQDPWKSNHPGYLLPGEVQGSWFLNERNSRLAQTEQKASEFLYGRKGQ